jgi:hypothetical protein
MQNSVKEVWFRLYNFNATSSKGDLGEEGDRLGNLSAQGLQLVNMSKEEE